MPGPEIRQHENGKQDHGDRKLNDRASAAHTNRCPRKDWGADSLGIHADGAGDPDGWFDS
jgi:hypothetical protein